MKINDIIKYASNCLNYLIDFVLPHTCIACAKEIERDLVCDDCLNLIVNPKPPLCPHCGRPVEHAKKCEFCRYERTLDYGRAFTLYVPPVNTMIHHLKYRGKTRIAKFFGMGMAGVI